jgi:hypothetical protein
LQTLSFCGAATDQVARDAFSREIPLASGARHEPLSMCLNRSICLRQNECTDTVSWEGIRALSFHDVVMLLSLSNINPTSSSRTVIESTHGLLASLGHALLTCTNVASQCLLSATRVDDGSDINAHHTHTLSTSVTLDRTHRTAASLHNTRPWRIISSVYNMLARYHSH